jgi:hypothetical protein
VLERLVYAAAYLEADVIYSVARAEVPEELVEELGLHLGWFGWMWIGFYDEFKIASVEPIFRSFNFLNGKKYIKEFVVMRGMPPEAYFIHNSGEDSIDSVAVLESRMVERRRRAKMNDLKECKDFYDRQGSHVSFNNSKDSCKYLIGKYISYVAENFAFVRFQSWSVCIQVKGVVFAVLDKENVYFAGVFKRFDNPFLMKPRCIFKCKNLEEIRSLLFEIENLKNDSYSGDNLEILCTRFEVLSALKDHISFPVLDYEIVINDFIPFSGVFNFTCISRNHQDNVIYFKIDYPRLIASSPFVNEQLQRIASLHYSKNLSGVFQMKNSHRLKHQGRGLDLSIIDRECIKMIAACQHYEKMVMEMNSNISIHRQTREYYMDFFLLQWQFTINEIDKMRVQNRELTPVSSGMILSMFFLGFTIQVIHSCTPMLIIKDWYQKNSGFFMFNTLKRRLLLDEICKCNESFLIKRDGDFSKISWDSLK